MVPRYYMTTEAIAQTNRIGRAMVAKWRTQSFLRRMLRECKKGTT